MKPIMSGRRIAVLLPCYNEEHAIASVVSSFKTALPEATIYVYDNNSSDQTPEIARRAGALVRYEPNQGKGNVVRRMFADIDADGYILADGDGTYTAETAPSMVDLLFSEQLDMVTGVRTETDSQAYRSGHRMGNRLLTYFVTALFRRDTQDLLSGYRVFSHRFVKSFPALSAGFEIETELTVHAMELKVPTQEIPTPYGARPRGSSSKLSTYRDGLRICRTIIILLKEERPLLVLGGSALLLFVLGGGLGLPVVMDFLATGLVPKFPTAILATGIMLLAALSLFAGIILDSIARTRRELRRLNYLRYAAPGGTQR